MNAVRRRLPYGLWFAPVLVCGVGAAYLVLVALNARPIADDWGLIADARQQSFVLFMHRNLEGSGRFSQFALSWLTSDLLGNATVNVLPLVLLVAAVSSAALTLRALSHALGSRISWPQAMAIALMAAVSVIGSSPSLYDTVAWFAAVGAYLAGSVVALLAVTLCAIRLKSDAPAAPFGVAATALLAAISGGFHELVGAILALAGILALLTLRDLVGGDGRRRMRVPLAALTVGATIGTAANILSPGAQHRAQAQGAHVSLVAAARTTINNISFVRADLHDGVILLALATGLVIWQVVGPVDRPQLRRWLWAWTAFLLLIPSLITGSFTAWAGATESGDRSPFRAAFIGTGSVCLAIALCLWLLLSVYTTLLSQRRASLLALLITSAGIVGLAHQVSPLLRAETMRARALAARKIAIRRQLAAGQTAIVLSAAPLLTASTQALDLSFGTAARQRPGWISAIKRFYGIPSEDAVIVAAEQPHDYCLPGVTAPWVGVRSCQQLQAEATAVR